MLQKLEQAGFEYSAADRLRVLRLLDRFAIKHLGNVRSLKYRFAPIFARNKNQQEHFYYIYDDWIKEISQDDFNIQSYEEEVQPSNKVKTKKNDSKINVEISFSAWLIGLLILVALLLIGNLMYNSFQNARKEESVRKQCISPPKIFSIRAPQQSNIEEDINFTLNRPLLTDEKLTWTLAGKILGNEEILEYSFDREGVYKIQAKIVKEVVGVCERTQFFQIRVGKQESLLERLLEVLYMYKTWIFLVPLIILLPYLWRQKWFITHNNIHEETSKIAEEQFAENLEQFFHAPDKAPYYIPYRDRNSFVRTDALLYRFANLLRQRQEGFRQEIDLPKTIQKTIAGGGFLDVAFQTTFLPSDYLFLVDDLSQHSHQKALLDYLVCFLRDKDIHLQVFHYEKSFNRFWNEEFSQGIDLARIHRLYPHHRLLVMGNGHELLKPFGGELLTQQHLREQLQVWKERLLLTPLPVASWTFQEQAIYDELMAVFPADLEGFQTAMLYLDLDEETAADYLPHFSKWEQQLAKNHPQPDINGREWSRFSTYQAYFANYPQVYTWFCALAVHPQPTWELTLAIGHALEGEQPLLTYDHLLLISHVPWLQGQSISPRLREQFLAAISLEIQTLARQVVEQELEAVKADVFGSHANFELQSELAIQQFMLLPDSNDARNRIYYLLNQQLLNRKQFYLIKRRIGINVSSKSSHYKNIVDSENSLMDYFKLPKSSPDEIMLYPELVFVEVSTDSINEGTLVVKDFYIGKYQVTNEQFMIFLNHYNSDTVKHGIFEGEKIMNSHFFGVKKLSNEKWITNDLYKKFPVTNITWYGAREYSKWLSNKTGYKYRLPYEVEWEYAAKGGIHSKDFIYAGSNLITEVAWGDFNSKGSPREVGSKIPNTLGIYDMCGNVWEWSEDIWAKSSKDSYRNRRKDFKELNREKIKIIVRGGGAWYDPYYKDFEISKRSYVNAHFSGTGIGFRIVRENV